MIEAGMTKTEVAKRLDIDRTTVQRWWRKYNDGEPLEDTPRSSEPIVVSRVPKIVITKLNGKKGQSTRKLAKRLTAKGYPMHASTVWRHRRRIMKVRPFKNRKEPLLTEKQRTARLALATAHRDWTVDDWRNILWTDEYPYEIFHAPNPQNDRVWTDDKAKVPTVKTVKHPPKIMVWGLMSFRALSELHVVPQKQMVNREYSINEILAKTCVGALNRTAAGGNVLLRRLLPDMSTAVVMQCGAPTQTAAATQQWCQRNLPAFWPKEEWPGNSPDLNPIENLWSFLQDKLDKLAPSTSIPSLTRNLKCAWQNISPDVLNNLVSSMPIRMEAVIKMNGGHIGK